MPIRKLLVAVAALCAAATSHAYFVRPVVQLDGAFVDGFVENGATQASVAIDTRARASVDLATGQTHNELQVTGPEQVGQSASVMGDRLTFAGAASTVNFSFAFDGHITTDGPKLGSELLQIGVFSYLRVFDASAGATWSNWTSLGGALVSDTRQLEFNDPDAALNELVDELLSGSFEFAGGTRTVDVFASLAVFSSVNDNPVVVTMDFGHTGTIGVDPGPGVVFASESGVFPGSVGVSPVPEPSTVRLAAAGLALLAWTAVRRRRDSCPGTPDGGGASVAE